MLNFDVKMDLSEQLEADFPEGDFSNRNEDVEYLKMHPDGDKTRMVMVMKDGTATLCTEYPDECEESITIKGDEVET